MTYYLEYKKTRVDVIDDSVVPCGALVASFPNAQKQKAVQYVEILNCQGDNLATILRQIGEEADG